MKLPSRFYPYVHIATLTVVLVLVVTFFCTYLNYGFGDDFIVRWLLTWITVWPLAWLTALIWTPFASRITRSIVKINQ
jgi:hypothetical protein